MKRIVPYTWIAYILLCTGILSCQSVADSEDKISELATNALSTEQYFEGNLCYLPHGSFFEESFSGNIIPIDMAGFLFMLETEHPEIINLQGTPIHVKLSGYLSPKPNTDNSSEMHLTVKRIKEINESKIPIEPMTGIYNGDGHTLTISSDRTYTLLAKNGSIQEGNWFLYSKSIMIMLSGDSKTIMKINHKKRSLNGRDDSPTVFTLATNLSNH